VNIELQVHSVIEGVALSRRRVRQRNPHDLLGGVIGDPNLGLFSVVFVEIARLRCYRLDGVHVDFNLVAEGVEHHSHSLDFGVVVGFLEKT